jgi:hypothetical protein
MRLYGAINKVEPQDDGTIKVHGIATTEAIDDQGEIVRAAAMRAALPDYMQFPAVREMHQLSAAGTALEADCGDDGITRIVAHVVDPVAVTKVKNLVYRGFSIGGRVTQREAGNPKTITGIVLNEISLVDRPANPEAIFDCWKSSMQTQPEPAAAFNPPIQIWACQDPSHRHIAKSEAMQCLDTSAAAGADAQQAAMEAAVKALEGETVTAPAPEPEPPAIGEPPAPEPAAATPALQPAPAAVPPVPEEPTTAEIIASLQQSLAESTALLAQTDPPAPEPVAEPPTPEPAEVDPAAKRASLIKGLWDVCHTAEIIEALDWLQESIAFEAEIEGDASPQPARMKAIIVELCGFLNALVAEETSELLDGDDVEVLAMANLSPMAMSAVARSLRKTITDTQTVELLVEQLEKAGARHNKSDQAHLDTIAFALHKAMELGTAKRAEMAALGRAHKAVLDIGAASLNADGREMLRDGNPTQGAGAATQHSTVDTGHNSRISTPNSGGAVPATPHPPTVSKSAASGSGPAFLMIEAMAKSGKGHGPLCACAHDLLHAVSDGATCKEGAAKPTRHNVDDMAAMHDLHNQLCMVDGVSCTVGAADSAATKVAAAVVAPVVPTAPAPTADADPLIKALADKDALTKLLGDIVPVIKAMHGRIEEIALAPNPPALVANAGGRDPARSNTGASEPIITQDQIAEALKGMSEEDRTLTLIKARKPLWINSLHHAPTQREARDELAARKA